MLRTSAIAFAFILLSASCSVSQPLEYKGYDNFVITPDKNEPKVNVGLQLYNPNPVGVKVKEMEFTIIVNDTALGTASLDHPVKIKRKQVFLLPVTASTTNEQLTSLIQPGLQMILLGKPVEIQIEGNVTIRKFIFKKTYAFDYSDVLKLSDLKF